MPLARSHTMAPGRITTASIGAGLAAGFVATVVISIMDVLRLQMGIMPEMNMIQMLTEILGVPGQMMVGWIAHFLVGTVFYGTAYALLAPYLPGQSHWTKGFIFGIGAAFLASVTFMPVGGAGWFGLKLGPMAPVADFMMHILFGLVLGGTYGWFMGRTAGSEHSGVH
jgi:hypothetical protein